MLPRSVERTVNSSHGRSIKFGGEGEIRTHEPREGLPVFKTDYLARLRHARITQMHVSRAILAPGTRAAGAGFPALFGPPRALCYSGVTLRRDKSAAANLYWFRLDQTCDVRKLAY